MIGRVLSAIGSLQPLARRRLSQRRRFSHRRPGLGNRPRLCRLEALEKRTLLSVSGIGSEETSVSWTPRVDAAWFEQLDSAPLAEQSPTVSLLDSLPTDSPTAASGESVDLATDRWLVQLTEEATRKAGSVAGTVGLLDGDPFQTQVVRGLGLQGMVLVATEPDANPTTVEAWLQDNPHVAYYEPDSILVTQTVPNDAEFDRLWGLHNTGQTGGTVDADIDAPEAWDLATGSGSIVVGIIDTGIDYDHSDLAANVWTNPAEVPGNGVDDDGNGFVDDVHGYDFANNDGDPMDDNGHGTHVAGTIAGVGDNGQGVTGVNWNGSVMALKFLDAEGNGFTSAAVEAVNYATMMSTVYGVDLRVTNNSWGGGGLSQALYDAVEASGEAGILFVAAAGNDYIDNDVEPHYPSSYDLPNVLAVAATDHNDNLALFSNYGASSVDLGAPGTDIYSTLPGGGYGSYSGSSMATPHVAGAAALAWASAPNATIEQVRNAILDGVDPVASLSGVVATGGRLNAHRTLQGLSIGVLSSDPAAESSVATPPVDFTVRFTHPYDPLSIDAADLTVNGTAADDVAVVDNQAVVFQFDTTPVVAEGVQVIQIGAGTILRAADGDPIDHWQATFYYDLVSLAVISATPSEAEILPAPPAQIILDFNEPIDAPSVGVDDLLLSVGVVTSATVVDDDTVAYAVDGLPREGTVTYTLPEGAIRDSHGIPGPAYVGQFALDDPLIERYVSGDVPKSITDYATTTSTLSIDESFAIADLDVELEIAHTHDGDLDAYLVGPGGTTVLLFSSVGGAGNGFSGTVLDDEAGTAIADGQPPFTGHYRPAETLSSFDGSDLIGTWTLVLSDHGGWDQGALTGWALVVQRGPELPPRVRSVDPLPPDGEDAWGIVNTLDVQFSKEMDPASVNSVAHWELSEAGPDDLFDTADDVDYPLAPTAPYAGGITVTLDTGVSRLPEGTYRFRAIAGGLVDPSGAPLDGNGDGVGGDDYRTHFTVLPHDWHLSDDVPQAIADLETITSSITIDESFPIADVDLQLDITHTYVADLDVYLIAPNGTRIKLFTDVGAGGENFSVTVLDDEADTAIGDGAAPFNGRYQPQQPLSAVDGLDAQGTWTLEISDDGMLDRGTLNSWAMIVERAADIPPEITSIDPLPADGGALWGPLDRFEVSFSEAMDHTTVNGGFWELRRAGADGLFDTIDDTSYSLSVTPPYVGGLATTLEVNVGYLPAGHYRLTAASGGLADLFGAPLDGNSDGLGGDDYATHFTLLSSNKYSAGDVPQAIVDLTTITSSVTVEHALTIADVDVQVDIMHTYNSDLDVYLIAPDGTRVELFTDLGASGDNFIGTILDDEAATSITSGTVPFDGRYRPEGPLSVLDGSNAQGTWTLEVTDDSSRDQGTLNGWALVIRPHAAMPPTVLGHQPDDLTLGPVDSLRIDFDGPMSESTFAPADDVLSFVGPQGSIVPTGFNWLSPQSLEITFAPQSAPGAYSLVLAPSILSDSGTALDQDGDSLPGEIPDDQYTASFIVADSLGVVTFVERDHLDLSAGDVWYYLHTSRQGSLTLQANFQVGDGSVELTLYDENLNDPTTVIATPTYGNRRIDRDVLADEAYYLKVSGTHADVDLRLANLLSQEGNRVTVYGTGADDQFEFEAAATHHVTINQVGYEFDPEAAATVVFLGEGGNDTATLRGNDGNDRVRLWPGLARLYGDTYKVVVSRVSSINVHGGGGTNVAQLYDDPSRPDTLEASPDSARFYGPAFDHQVFAYGYVHAYATEAGGDVAKLYDLPGGRDTLDATPAAAKLYGDGFFNRAVAFDHVLAYASPDDVDIALLHDDPLGADVFEGTPDSVSLTGAGFDNQAHGFRYVHAYATEGGNDVATLGDDPTGRDYYKATPHDARLYGDGFYNRVVEFDHVHAYGTLSSSDVALLYDDPDGLDHLLASPQSTSLAGAGFDNQAHDFRYVHAYATEGGGDLATLTGDPTARDTFKATPYDAKLYGNAHFNRVVEFDHVLAYGTSGNIDVAFLYDDPAEKDAFEATPDSASLIGTGFDNQAHGFPYVHAYATEGGGDEARLYDDPAGQDTFKATPHYGSLAGNGFFNRAVTFDQVTAYGTPSSGDVALLYDDAAGKDAFEATPDYAVLSGNGFANRAESFRYVHAYATPGGNDEAHLYDSENDDIFKAAPDYGKLYSGDFFVRAKSFAVVKAYAANGGNDTAYLYDSALDDLLEARDDWASLSNAILGFANWAIGFEWVEATASNEGDTKVVDEAVDFLHPFGPW